MANAIQRYLSLDGLRVTTNDGEDLSCVMSSLTYNAAISAYEIRAPRPADAGARTIRDLTGRGPLQLRVVRDDGTATLFRIHYEAVTYVPIELRAADYAAEELHVLRGARAEVA